MKVWSSFIGSVNHINTADLGISGESLASLEALWHVCICNRDIKRFGQAIKTAHLMIYCLNLACANNQLY